MTGSYRNAHSRQLSAPLRLMMYDRTCRGPHLLPGLTHVWSVGGIVYNALGRFDVWHGVASWAEGLDWLLGFPDGSIAEIQFWGHGDWGGLWIDEELLKVDALSPGHAEYQRLAAVKSKLLSDGSALWWFRCCDTFGTKVGQDFARAWTSFFGCRAAGHTYHIKFLQSGLHVLAPGIEPNWPAHEGVVPWLSHARSSHLMAPRTITCFHGAIPASWHE